MQVLVVGAGVSGLSCAVALLEAGHDVLVWARRLPPHTTSNVAAAFWYPYRADPPQRVLGWARASHTRFVELAESSAPSGGSTGVARRPAIELVEPDAPWPWWADAVPSLRAAVPEELPPGARAGLWFEGIVVDTRRYLVWLQERIAAKGGRIEVREVASLREALAERSIVVNCTGLAARELCGDRELFPIRGQIVRVEDPGLVAVMLDERLPGEITYVVPRGDDVVLGGTTEIGDEDLAVRPAATAAILARVRALHPALGDARVLAHAVGLRPGRSTVRLEPERIDAGLVVHDYGHGGAGVTLSWGCAAEVVAIVAAEAR
ncbi:MAG TPA: FAD-dependent oxidoreductase [Nannocystaceae bacterium]|nr:FAD-dependent oxidoreductase [Nannocystaceae bacterium]